MKRIIRFMCVALLFLIGCSSATKNTDNVEPEKQSYNLYLDLKSEYNLLFNTYDVQINIDDEEVGTIPNGKVFSQLITLEEGPHKIVISKAGDFSNKTQKTINLDGDMTFKCDISHGSSIELKNIEMSNDISGSATIVPDVCGMILSDAETKLKETGFDNVNSEGIGATIWNSNNWLVQSQSVLPEAKIDRHEEIVLTCIHLDDYFNELFTGKTLNEIEELAANNWYSVTYEDDSHNDMDDTVNQMSSEEMNSWVAYEARQYSAENKTAKVYLKKSQGSKKTDTADTNAMKKDEKPETKEENEQAAAKPKSKDFESSADYHVVEQGSYLVKIPSNWIPKEKGYSSSDKANAATVSFGGSSDLGLGEGIRKRLTDEVTLNYPSVTEVICNKEITVNGIKMQWASYIIQEPNSTPVRYDFYVYVDSKTSNANTILFGQPENSDYDYTDDFNKIIHSISDNPDFAANEEPAVNEEENVENPYQVIKELNVSGYREYVHSGDSAVALNETIDVTINAKPAGLTKDDFYFYYDENILSFTVDSISSSDNSTTIKGTVTALSPGTADFIVVSCYDVFEDFEEPLADGFSVFCLDESDSRLVYITPEGEKYHFSRDHAGENAMITTIYDAIGLGYEPCGVCGN